VKRQLIIHIFAVFLLLPAMQAQGVDSLKTVHDSIEVFLPEVEVYRQPSPVVEDAFHLSKTQIIRLLWSEENHGFDGDSILPLLQLLTPGFQRDSCLVWLEEGGIAGDEARLHEAIMSNHYQLMTETYNYLGDVSHVDLSLVWYGIFRVGDAWNMLPVKPRVVLSQFQGNSGMEFDMLHNRTEGSQFMFGSPVMLDSGMVGSVDERSLRFMPGSSRDLKLKRDDPSWTLGALGAAQGFGDCPPMTNYQLMVSGQLDDRDMITTQDITLEVVDSNYTCPPELYWYGDLMGDGRPDAILMQNIPKGLRLVLFLSDIAAPGDLWRRAADWYVTFPE